jgi:methionyl-tRNA formyltransferase
METTPRKLNFVFFGTPDVASKTLEILKENGFVPSLIITGPDRPVGRHFVMTPPPVKVWAMENNVPFIQPDKLSPDSLLTPQSASGSQLPFAGEHPDFFIVVAYGKILSQEVIDMPKLGTLNIHYSLLPRWRGASPVEAAILHGDLETGVSIQKMVYKLDAGPVIREQRTFIDPNETHEELRNRLIPMGADLLVSLINENDYEGKEQDEEHMTHCGKTKKQDGLVDPIKDDPQELWNKYRAYYGWPGIYYLDQDGKRVKITKARFENSKFIIERIIPEGKKEITLN